MKFHASVITNYRVFQSFFGRECSDYTDHLSYYGDIDTLGYDGGGDGSRLLFIIIWHTAANDPYRADTR